MLVVNILYTTTVKHALFFDLWRLSCTVSVNKSCKCKWHGATVAQEVELVILEELVILTPTSVTASLRRTLFPAWPLMNVKSIDASREISHSPLSYFHAHWHRRRHLILCKSWPNIMQFYNIFEKDWICYLAWKQKVSYTAVQPLSRASIIYLHYVYYWDFSRGPGIPLLSLQHCVSLCIFTFFFLLRVFRLLSEYGPLQCGKLH